MKVNFTPSIPYGLMFLFMLCTTIAYAQGPFNKHSISVNAFRNPSIGVEYHYRMISAHMGFYPTNFERNTTTRFMKIGATAWFFRIGKRVNPSSFYASLAYLRGFSRDYDGKNALVTEVGFRWMIWKGINLRIGAAALFANGETPKFNPTPGIGYTFGFESFKKKPAQP